MVPLFILSLTGNDDSAPEIFVAFYYVQNGLKIFSPFNLESLHFLMFSPANDWPEKFAGICKHWGETWRSRSERPRCVLLPMCV